MRLAVGQQIEIDLIALHLPGGTPSPDAGMGIVMALDPGAITVRLDLGDGGAEITVSPGRVRR